MVVVPKPNGTVCLRVDMRMANTAIKSVRYLIPTVEMLPSIWLEQIMFSKLGLNKAYHQLKLEPEGRGTTSFCVLVDIITPMPFATYLVEMSTGNKRS